ncbi:NAD(P)/FAD-dependent oxidoreductase [Rhodococcus sp. HNM0569]|uniref:flavin-containing monooxygenase n=1 Tax=Rhodococcus sp. HNM0569 TaxID=2716340 RepID=UPI00146E06F0|nr:NAD(P)/FAD-dependent oxidoreductase [Rhodococcus sp. HNM0569]NLU83678.1 NAD(P)/FAD-dependent oxidoreductase [Rhodococcus sp. HNM0569]
MTTHLRVGIIGAGFGGLGTAIRLRQEGIDDFLVFERADEIGGTWQANTYPGAQCDIPSILYSFSFAPEPRWSRLYPLQAEIKSYLEMCTDRFGIRSRLRLGHEVTRAAWDDDAQRWCIDTDRGSWTADVLVAAMGPFSEPAVPKLPGLDTFAGTVFHSAQWNHEHDVTDRRVGVVGTGASAVQFIPRLQPKAGHLTVFQRTPTWIMPHPDRPIHRAVQRLFARVPGVQKAARRALDLVQESLVPGLVYRPALLTGAAAVGRRHLRRQVSDPALREALTPSYSFGCKRPTFSNAYYPALAADNVDVVTSGIASVEENAVVTDDGRRHEIDTLVFGTGFELTGNSGFGTLVGRDGRTLAEQWAGGEMKAYLGTTIENFPNMFMLLGPNSVVYTSQVVTIEAQIDYVLSALAVLGEHDLGSLEVRADVQQDFVERTDDVLAGSVWNSGGCSSYYLSPSGRNFTFWPGFNASFRRRMRALDVADYRVRPRSHADAVVRG